MFRKRRTVLSVAIFLAVVSSLAFGQRESYVDGLWAHGNTIVLLARFDRCGGPYRAIQPIVSTDGGRTWAAEGPRLEGSDLLFILREGDELLIGGQDYAEGPTSSPFLLTYSFDKHEWSQFEIYGDAADLLGLAREKANGHLLAWVQHIERPEDDSGPIILHESVDGGKTWSEIKNVAHVPASLPGLRFFQDLPNRSGKWRVSPAGNAIEELINGQWNQRTKLPLPVQSQCPEIQDDTRP
jgi:hypothetical protein